jgi:hypothetical protein
LSLKLQIHFSYQDLFRSFNQAFHRNTVEILIWFWSFSALFLQLHYYCMRGIIKGIRSFWHSLVLFWFCLLCQGFCLIQILMYNGYKHVCFLHFFYLGDLHNSLEFTDVKNTNSDTSPPPQYNKLKPEWWPFHDPWAHILGFWSSNIVIFPRRHKTYWPSYKYLHLDEQFTCL